MDEIQLGPTICGAVAWGCGLNMIMFAPVAAKENWDVPADYFMIASRVRTLGKVGIFVAMMVCAAGAGYWALLVAPAGGTLFGGFSTAILKQNTPWVSFFGGILCSVAGTIWAFVG
jgi:hypothetical protein